MYPPVEPYAEGMLDVGDGNAIRWEISGDPRGKAAVVVHGGPGSGCVPGMRQQFDPRRYRVVLFDQRGCGGSRPHASDPATDMAVNTTAHLVADMELLREHLGIDRWLLCGGSWGSTLALAYAQAHPDRVTGIVLSSVTMTRRCEIDWLYRGVGRFLPERWAAFRAAVRGADLLAGYARAMADADPAVRAAAATAWCTWEDAVLALEPTSRPGVFGDRPTRERDALVRTCAHYFSNGAFLEDGALLRDAHRLAGIPGVLVHGRLDMGGPPHTAWALAHAWPDAELHVIEGAGHLAHPAKRVILGAALDAFAG